MIYKLKCFFCKKQIEVEGEFRGEIIRCPECNKELAIPISAIDEDGKTGDDEDKEKEEKQKELGKTKYPALRSISNFLSVIAYILLVGATGGALYFLFLSFFPEDKSGLKLIIFLSIFGCLIFFILFRAFSELIKLLIDIEKNTRKYE